MLGRSAASSFSYTSLHELMLLNSRTYALGKTFLYDIARINTYK
jgi:hypothetical protein